MFLRPHSHAHTRMHMLYWSRSMDTVKVTESVLDDVGGSEINDGDREQALRGLNSLGVLAYNAKSHI